MCTKYGQNLLNSNERVWCGVTLADEEETKIRGGKSKSLITLAYSRPHRHIHLLSFHSNPPDSIAFKILTPKIIPFLFRYNWVPIQAVTNVANWH